MEQINDRSVVIQLTSGRLVKRNCQDIIIFGISANLDSKLDILDMPLYGTVTHDTLTLNSSQFNYYLLTISKQDVLHGKNVQIPHDNDTNSEQSEDKTEEIFDAGNEDMLLTQVCNNTQTLTGENPLIHRSG